MTTQPDLTANDYYPVILLALCIWREARGEPFDAKTAVAWSIRNRVNRPRWWGHTFESCILMPYQYSSFNRNDPNSAKLPVSSDPNWTDALTIAIDVYLPTPTLGDKSCGADSYYDRSLDGCPPEWAAQANHTADVGAFHFFRTP